MSAAEHRKFLPTFSVYQVFLYALSAIVVFCINFNVLFFHAFQNSTKLLSGSEGVEKFTMAALFFTAVFFFVLGSFILSLLILNGKTKLDQPKLWLLYGFAGLYSTFVGFLTAADSLERAVFNQFFDFLYLGYFIIIVFQGFYILALLFAKNSPGIPASDIDVKRKYSPVFLFLSSAIVFSWLYYGIMVLGVPWYLVIAPLFLVINILDYIINSQLKKI